MGLTAIQIFIFILLFLLSIFLIRQSLMLRREERINRYSINPIRLEEDSIFDRLYLKYLDVVNKIGEFLSKSKFIFKISKRYEKYILVGDETKTIDFIAHKIFIGILFVIVVLFSYAFQRKSIGLFGILFFFLVGYFIFDIYLIYSSKIRIKKIKNDMLRAVMIMNNAFKSGKSTLQAVYIASMELPYPINYEFKKIYQDMKYGLSVDIVFDRFARRVDIEEARYLSSSLTILNKTGGNIVAVFTSIEKTLFDKKKLEEELKNLTGASNLVVKILLFVPFVFAGIIYVLNPSYFDPLFSSVLGYMIIVLIVIMSIVYICILQRIMKVRF